MPLTAAEFRTLLGPRLRQVLKACAPESNRGGWLDRLADKAEVSGSWLESYFYGEEPEQTPRADYLLAVCSHLIEQSGPGVAQALIGDFLGVHIGAGETAAEQHLEAAKEWWEQGQVFFGGQVIPMKGRR